MKVHRPTEDQIDFVHSKKDYMGFATGSADGSWCCRLWRFNQSNGPELIKVASFPNESLLMKWAEENELSLQ
jgi:hypothetical protein